MFPVVVFDSAQQRLLQGPIAWFHLDEFSLVHDYHPLSMVSNQLEADPVLMPRNFVLVLVTVLG